MWGKRNSWDHLDRIHITSVRVKWISTCFYFLYVLKFHQHIVDLLCFCVSLFHLCPTLSNPMDCSTPGFPDLHYLPEFAQTHVHWIGDAIQPSHLLSPLSSPTLSFSQHQGLFQLICSSHQVAKVQASSISPSSECSELISFRIGWKLLMLRKESIHNRNP